MPDGDETQSQQTRRAFVGGAAALGAGGLGGLYLPAAAEAGQGRRRRRYRERHRVDVHAHHLGPGYVAALRAAGINLIGGIPIPEWSPQRALGFMQRYGIAFQMLSVSDPGVSFLSGSAAVDLARQTNEYAASVIRAHPRRFGAFAVVPLPDVDAALAEVRHSLDTLKLHGVGLLSSYAGRYLGDPAFEPLLQELNRRRSWVFVHPTAVAADDKPQLPIPDFTYEYPFDTTRTIISLLFSASFKRYRRIRWHFAHGGATIPMLRFRMRALAANARQFGALLGLPPAAQTLVGADADHALERAFYDTALVADPPPLEAVSQVTSVRHIVFGSDWPFAERLYPSKGDPQPALSTVFSNRERHAIERLNGRREFRQLAPVVPAG